jgi:PIN domain nuclease of toxin-antitoxin system
MERVYQVTRPKLLIDTQILLWAVNDDARLSARHREILGQDEGLVISVVSILEIAIKRSIGKLQVKGDLLEALRLRGIPLLPLNEHHALYIERLPYHHRDPFDRLLIAQAQVESLTILTADPQFSRYDVALA